MRRSISGFILFTALLFVSAGSHAQTNETWQRVTTGEDFTVDVDSTSLVFKPSQILEARYRTEYSKSETLAGNPPVKYKARVDTIQFNIADYSYRILEVSLLDSKGRTVQSLTADDKKPWKQIRDGSSGRLFDSLENLAPLGNWTVNSYRVGEADANGRVDGSDELPKLLGSVVSLGARYAQAGTRRCSSVSYESRKLTDKDLERLLGVSIQGLGVNAGPIDMIAMKCESKEWLPEQSILIRIAPARMLMLWNGAFIELIGEKDSFPLPRIAYDDGTKILQVQKPE